MAVAMSATWATWVAWGVAALALAAAAYHTLSWRAVPVTSQRAAYATARDVSERKKLDHIKDDFISVVSHELRTPLTSIRGSLGLLAGGVGGEIPGPARELIEIAAKN